MNRTSCNFELRLASNVGMNRINLKMSPRVSILAAICALGISLRSGSQAQSMPTELNRAPVIVELFTSEGCSSCPPADALLLHLEQQQPIPAVQVIALEVHVDYWNHLGWSDPFSAAEWTQRQQEYVSAFKGDGAYTPQMVVDGQSQFVGSRTKEAATVIEAAAAHAKAGVSVKPVASQENSTGEFRVSVGKLTGANEKDFAEVWLAIAETGLHSDVGAGENSGKKLYHAAVLRSLHKIGLADGNKNPASFEGVDSVKLKSGWKRENLLVIVIVQEKKSRRILGVAESKVGI
jgi:hypothetical protein